VTNPESDLAPAADDLDPDLAFAFALADAADGVTLSHFRVAAHTAIRKDDGTPVSQVDLMTEQAMMAAVGEAQPGDAVTGEEVGHHPGENGRRWIFDGIDGTHNYGEGRAGWGTIIALEVDGQKEIGVVTSPALGRRWWARRGGGAWSAGYEAGSFDPSTGTRLHCGDRADLGGAKVLATPYQGFMLGWRSDAATRFVPPEAPRAQCFALDAAMVAEGEADAAVLLFGHQWDYAASSVIVTEAGGVFRDAWGTQRFDTSTAVFANEALAAQAVEALAPYRPDKPDVPVVASTVSKPIGGGSTELDGWRAFGISTMPTMSGRSHVYHAPAPVLDEVDERAAHLHKPFVGVTTDGRAIGGLRSLDDGVKVSTAPIAEAALAFLQALTPGQRARASYPMDATEWRTWINVHMNHFRHGVLLDDLPPATRDLALGIARATLSARGYDQARSILAINGLLAEFKGDDEAFGEWLYCVSIFGDPASGEPWGWQFDGHHLCLNTVVFGGRIVTTPAFMGSEPRRIRQGRLAGTSLFDPEEELGIDLIRSFDDNQRSRAILHPSTHPNDIPTKLSNLFDGRMLAGAFHDNLIAPYQGVAGSEMSDGQRRILTSLARTYVDWNAEPHAEASWQEVAAHLDETWFSWYGGTGDDDPFYYRVHSPVILIEFDHHPGVVFDNWFPTRHHVHTVVRTPNGGDYGTDLLRQHHERFDHSHGRHDPHH
jgi:fructose-1,6-bisphosphatase/inositol monophosphatase family enzyme